jgi:hypothetical protein
MQKETLVSILQASDADNAAATDPLPADVATGPDSSSCAAELHQIHTEIIEETALLRQESVKNPVKAQALRRLTTSIADLGVSSLSSHIPASQLDVKRYRLPSISLLCCLYKLQQLFNTLLIPVVFPSLFTTTRALDASDRHAIASCCTNPGSLGAAEAYFYRAVHAGSNRFPAMRTHRGTSFNAAMCFLVVSKSAPHNHSVVSLRPIVLTAPAEVPSKDLQVFLR